MHRLPMGRITGNTIVDQKAVCYKKGSGTTNLLEFCLAQRQE